MLHLDSFRCQRTAWLTILPLAFSSCGSGDKPNVSLVPIKGQVSSQGQPARGARVILHPLESDGNSRWEHGFPSGTVAADGSLTIQTAGKWDGAPAGEYAVVVLWIATTAEGERTSEEAAVDRLAGKYADPASSPWKVKVEGTGCVLPPIDLQ